MACGSPPLIHFLSCIRNLQDVGPVKFDGSHDSQQSKGRTSENAWCSVRQGCRQEEIPNRIHERIAEVLTIPAVNSEDLQILKYEVGQFYNTHHVSECVGLEPSF